MIKLSDYKNHKKNKIMDKDLDAVLHIINLTIKALSFYNMYRPVQDVLFHIENNKMTLELYSKKLKNIIKEYKE